MEKGASTLYHQLARTLRERIIAGQYLAGEKIPTEPQLCEEFGMSRITVRQAVTILENEGMVQRQQGRGTFVLDLNRQSLGWNYGKVEDLLSLAKQSRLELTGKRKVMASEEIARDLEIPPGQSIYSFKGIRHIKNKAKASYRAYVIESIGREIKIKSIRHAVLFAEIEAVTSERINSAKRIMYATLATEGIAEEMDVKTGSALQATKGIFYNELDRPLMVAITKYPGEMYQSTVLLERK